ncbi:hypothetical protein TrVE_jg10146 [Triparma verrucosa]|uniref:Amine oxidase domain-containing protein n=1 Tax=Triparma verrucosa TaxID=1606542 RepID=A0A9W7BXY2_9STRA|nr:hypothetical protein TrVE_jg10146 [Triparma verrucosa]
MPNLQALSPLPIITQKLKDQAEANAAAAAERELETLEKLANVNDDYSNANNDKDDDDADDSGTQTGDDDAGDDDADDTENTDNTDNTDNNNNSFYNDPDAKTLEELDNFSNYLQQLQDSVTNDLPSTINAAKFSRILTEKYGFLKPLITNPTVSSYIKTLQRAYLHSNFSPFGEPRMSPGGIVMFLAMLNRFSLPPTLLGLIVCFLLSLKPWFIILTLALARFVSGYRKKQFTGPNDSSSPKPSILNLKNSPAFNNLTSSSSLPPVGSSALPPDSSTEYDVIILGPGLSSLYAASLLSLQNFKVLLISEGGCSISSVTHDGVTFDSEDFTAKRLLPIQKHLSAAVRTSSDPLGGVRLYRLGSPSNAYASSIIQCGQSAPFVVSSSLISDFSSVLLDGFDGSTSLEPYLHACSLLKSDASKFFNRKIIDPNTQSLMDAFGGYLGKGSFHECSVRYSQDLFRSLIPKSATPLVRSHIAGVGFKAENISPSSCSMGVQVLEAGGGEGAWRPVGGGRVLGKAMENVIKEAGGEVYNLGDTKIERLVFETPADSSSSATSTAPPPKCTGVKTSDGRVFTAKIAVISSLPLQHTLVNLIDSSIRSKTPVENLELLKERRPLLKLYLTFNKSSSKLELPCADFWRLPSASLPVDEVKHDEAGNRMGVKQGDIGAEPQPPKFTPGTSWCHVTFPSAQDPSWETLNDPETSCCVVTVEADEDFVIAPEAGEATLSYKINSTSTTTETKANMKRKILSDLQTLFPTLTPEVVSSSTLSDVIRRGLTHNCMRFAAKCVKPSTPYPNLYLSGEDLTFDSMSGRIAAGAMAANAVLGYDVFDLMFLGKSVVEDLHENVGGVTPKTKGEKEAIKLSKSGEAKKND